MTDRLEHGEARKAIMLLFVHILLLPILVNLSQGAFPGLMSTEMYNLLYYSVSTLLCLALLGKYLRRSLDNLLAAPKEAVKALLWGVAMLLALSLICGSIVSVLGIEGSDPNSRRVQQMMDSQRGLTMLLTVLLAPIVEETLFRGGIFCVLYERSRAEAYAVTVLLFSVYHVWQFAAASGDLKYLLYAIAYVPAAVSLCFVYEKSGSVWASIIFHAGYNLLAQLTGA